MGTNKDNLRNASLASLNAQLNLEVANGGSTREGTQEALIEAAEAKMEMNICQQMYDDDPEG